MEKLGQATGANEKRKCAVVGQGRAVDAQDPLKELELEKTSASRLANGNQLKLDRARPFAGDRGMSEVGKSTSASLEARWTGLRSSCLRLLSFTSKGFMQIRQLCSAKHQ